MSYCHLSVCLYNHKNLTKQMNVFLAHSHESFCPWKLSVLLCRLVFCILSSLYVLKWSLQCTNIAWPDCVKCVYCVLAYVGLLWWSRVLKHSLGPPVVCALFTLAHSIHSLPLVLHAALSLTRWGIQNQIRFLLWVVFKPCLSITTILATLTSDSDPRELMGIDGLFRSIEFDCAYYL